MKNLPIALLLALACSSSEPVLEAAHAPAAPRPSVAAAPEVAAPTPAAPAAPVAQERGREAQDHSGADARAEALYAEGSFALAREIYSGVDLAALEDAERRWVEFRLGDTLWRAQAQTQTPDPSSFDAARDALERLVRDVKRDEDKDRVWAEVKESLGDFHWLRAQSQDWGSAWPHYQAALDHWARSTDLALARERYLAIVWKGARFVGATHPDNWYGIPLPDDVVENALRIAQTPEEQARAHFLRALTLRDRAWDWRSLARTPREFEAAIALGSEQPWYDDALFQLAQWYESRGRPVREPHGGWRGEPDYVTALKLYRRIVEEFQRGESRYVDSARSRIVEITQPQLSIAAASSFLPGSEVALELGWRNQTRLEFRLFRVDLLRDLSFERQELSGGQLAHAIDVRKLEALERWSKDTADAGDHRPGQERVRVPKPLAAGAYVVEVSGSGLRVQELVLVADAALVLKSARATTYTWFVEALSGAPIAGAEVKLWERSYEHGSWIWRTYNGRGDEQGLTRIVRAAGEGSHEIVAVAKSGERTAFAVGNAYLPGPNRGWRILALTDRPAYRPEDRVQWKVVARTFDGSTYATPAGARLGYSIHDPHGAKVREGTLELSPFGGAFGELELASSMTLGEYSIVFHTAGKDDHIGSAKLFRLEEYKLPEFRVSVTAPEENGRRKIFRTGDTIEVEIAAELYSGGAVAGAQVEVLVYQSPYWALPPLPREFPWLYDEASAQRWRSYGGGSIVHRETLRTDAEGKTRVRFATPADVNNDFEYRIEARVIDASRREVVASGEARVARQSYHVRATPVHSIVRPRDPLEVEFVAQDANGEPVEAEGVVEVWRERWSEVWIDPLGREVEGREAWRAGDASVSMPPAGWRWLRGGYQRESVLTRPIRTDREGRARFEFTPEREGCYRIGWASRDDDGAPIQGECMVWVADESTRDLVWRAGEVDILVDRDTLREGEEAVVMLSTATSGAWVLFAVEGEALHDLQVVHLSGTAKLMRIKLDARHVPNFYLSATLIRGGDAWQDIEELVVPPLSRFLSVEITPASGDVRPGSKGAFTVTTRDQNGEPIAAEVALAAIDEAVLAIQESYASDPRRFFYGERRSRAVDDATTMSWRRFVRLGLDEQGVLVDRRLAGLAGEELERDGQRYDFKDEDGRLGMRRREMSMQKSVAAEGMLDSLQAGAYRGAGNSAPASAPVLGELPNVTVRADFRATALWKPDAVTGADGRARVELVWPESLSSWKSTGVAASADSRFGIATATARTVLPLTARLQSPRFLVVGDQCTLSVLVDNHTAEGLRARVELAVEGLRGDALEPRTVDVAAGATVRVDWSVRAGTVGRARIVARAFGLRGGKADPELADAMERSFTVFERGIDKLVAASTKLDGSRGGLAFELPAARRPGSTRVVVQVAPSLAVTMLDALPYLIDYPYGCTEQTMSRFLPAVIVNKTLADLGLDPAAAMTRTFGGIEPETAGKTHGPRRDLAALAEIERLALERLYDFQHADGGWAWWKTGDTDRFMSAYVVWGLALAREAGVGVREDVLSRGAQFLDLELVKAEAEPDMAAWMLHALAANARARHQVPTPFQQAAIAKLWEQRAALNAYTRALFALAVHDFGDAERARVLAQNLANGVSVDRAPDTSALAPGQSGSGALATAHWGADGIVWRWSQGSIESTATALRALLAIDPGNPLVEPAMNWLVKNRRGAQWSSTRDTAIAVLALNAYLKTSGEIAEGVEYELAVNGAPVAKQKLSRAELLSAPGRFSIDAAHLRDGRNEIALTKRAGRTLYVSVEARFFSLEEPIQPAGNELFVAREYRVVEVARTLLAGYVMDERALEPGHAIASGARVRTRIRIEAKNDLEYLMLEDFKPAGLEAVALKSGEPLTARELRADALARRLADDWRGGAERDQGDFTGRTRSVHQELRDRKVAVFVDKLPQGVWEIEYEMRAEVPGSFDALPVVGQAMYVPEIRGNGLETRIEIR